MLRSLIRSPHSLKTIVKPASPMTTTMLAKRFFKPATPKKETAIAIVVGELKNNEKAVLLGKRAEREVYQFPGGHKEPSENFLQAAKRELSEETGLCVKDAKEKVIYANLFQEPNLLHHKEFVKFDIGRRLATCVPYARDDLVEVKIIPTTLLKRTNKNVYHYTVTIDGMEKNIRPTNGFMIDAFHQGHLDRLSPSDQKTLDDLSRIERHAGSALVSDAILQNNIARVDYLIANGALDDASSEELTHLRLMTKDNKEMLRKIKPQNDTLGLRPR